MNPSSAIESAMQENALPQYSRRKVLGLCALATLPMILITWVIAPALVPLVPAPAVLTYWLLLIPNAAWILGLTLWILRREAGGTNPPSLVAGLKLNGPRDRKTGRPRTKAYLQWLIPCAFFVLILFILMLYFRWLVPGQHFLSWPSFANIAEAGSPEWAGRWGWVIAAFLLWGMNMLLAEEIFFRGLLLPRMRKAFGRADWPANAVLYGLYCIATPFIIPFRILLGMLAAGLARRYRSLRMALFVRGMEGALVMALVLIGVGSRPFPPFASLPDLPRLGPGGIPYDTRREPLAELPAPWPGETTLDLRNSDLSALDLSGTPEIIAGDVTFNSNTVWPGAERLPAGFDPQRIMELGFNPGLGVRSLHARGITGRGVGIAVIDQPLLTGHVETAGRLRWYETVSLTESGMVSMHGPAVSSIAAGRTAGAAPEADLYYFSYDVDPSALLWQLDYVATGIRRVLQLNQVLPPDQRIRVISISLGWDPYSGPGYYDVAAAVEEARARGVLVVHTSMQYVYGIGYMGLDRGPLDDPDQFESFKPSPWWEETFFSGRMPGRTIYAPMDSRTAADPAGANAYAFYRRGGLSWTTPWIAGVYALAVQVDPTITPERFLDLALETGRTIDVQHEGKNYRLGPILDPVALIAALETGE
jgi:membrane protease YdiL (CAAX protease family)